MVKSFTNVETYLGILFIFAILVTALIFLGNEILSNENSNLDNDSIEYILQLNGANVSDYATDIDDLENPILSNANYSQGSPKDEALDFLFTKEKGFKIEVIVKRIFNIPSFVIVDLFRLPLNNWKWLLDIIGWLLGLTVTITMIYFVRGLINK